jgi:hypothetical protein
VADSSIDTQRKRNASNKTALPPFQKRASYTIKSSSPNGCFPHSPVISPFYYLYSPQAIQELWLSQGCCNIRLIVSEL